MLRLRAFAALSLVCQVAVAEGQPQVTPLPLLRLEVSGEIEIGIAKSGTVQRSVVIEREQGQGSSDATTQTIGSKTTARETYTKDTYTNKDRRTSKPKASGLLGGIVEVASTGSPAGLLAWAGGAVDHLLTPKTLTDFGSKTFREVENSNESTQTRKSESYYKSYFKGVDKYDETIDLNKGFIELPLRLDNQGSDSLSLSSIDVTFSFSDCGENQGSEFPLTQHLTQSTYLGPGQGVLLRLRVEGLSIEQLALRLGRCGSFSVSLNRINADSKEGDLLARIDALRQSRAVVRVRHPGHARDYAVELAPGLTLTRALETLGYQPVYKDAELIELAGIKKATKQLGNYQERTGWVILMRSGAGQNLVPEADRLLRAGDIVSLSLFRILSVDIKEAGPATRVSLSLLNAGESIVATKYSFRALKAAVLEVEVSPGAMPPPFAEPTYDLRTLRRSESGGPPAREALRTLTPRKLLETVPLTDPVRLSALVEGDRQALEKLKPYLFATHLVSQFTCVETVEPVEMMPGLVSYARPRVGGTVMGIEEGMLDALPNEWPAHPPVEVEGPSKPGPVTCGFKRIPKAVTVGPEVWVSEASEPRANPGTYRLTYDVLRGGDLAIVSGAPVTASHPCLMSSLCSVEGLGGAIASSGPMGFGGLAPYGAPPPQVSVPTRDAFRFGLTLSVSRIGENAVGFLK